MSAAVKVTLNCPPHFHGVEKTFSFPTKVSAVKDHVCKQLGELPDNVQILCKGQTLEDSTPLAMVDDAGRKWFAITKTLDLDVQIITPGLPDLSGSGSSSDDSRESSDMRVHAALAKVFEQPSEVALESLRRILAGQLDSEMVGSLFASSVDGSTSPMDAAVRFYDTLCDVGWDTSVGALVQFANGQGAGTTGSPVSPTGTTHHDSPTQTFSCPVCFDEFSVETRFESWCGNADHALCYGCAEENLKANQGDAEIKCFQQGCEHDMTLLEIAIALGRGNAQTGQNDPLYAKIDQLKLRSALAKDPDQYCACPEETCTWTVARSAKGASEKATCGDCSRTFCTNCLDTYHYRATCIERSQIKRAWQSWTVTGRSTYWKEDAKMRAKAEERANREKERIERVAREEKQDEEWKANNCRHCPHCGRIVEKLGGCNLMRCGYEPDDGGNVQDGCKRKFYWSEAKPYKAVPAGQQVKFKPTKSKDKVLHEGWSCDECRKEIRGLRFECINCESWYICEQCDNTSRSHHDPGHCFRIHTAAS